MSEIDYSKYDLSELHEALNSADVDLGPRDEAMIEHWIKVREKEKRNAKISDPSQTVQPAENEDQDFHFEPKQENPFNILDFFLSPSGRIGRSSYWLGFIAIFLITLAAEGIFKNTLPWLYILTVIPMIIIGYILCIKRAHDRGRTGWFTLLLIIPIVSFWPVIELGFFKGTVGENKYGKDPLASA